MYRSYRCFKTVTRKTHQVPLANYVTELQEQINVI